MLRARFLTFTGSLLFTIPCWTFAQSRSNPAAPHPQAPPGPTEIAATGYSSSTCPNIADLPDAPFPRDAQSQSHSQTQSTNQTAPPAQTQQTTPPQQTPPAAGQPSLQSLGFPTSVTQGSAQQQALLNKRTHMLKVHQTLGLITLAPMIATLFTGPQAKAKGKSGEPITEPTTANLDTHLALGAVTTGLYWTTAYYAIFAPKVPGVKPKGAIRLHRDLEWVHGPGMILTGVLGIMAYNQENSGEKVHGIASAHGTVAYVTAAAYGASIVAVSWPIHWKFWEK